MGFCIIFQHQNSIYFALCVPELPISVNKHDLVIEFAILMFMKALLNIFIGLSLELLNWSVHWLIPARTTVEINKCIEHRKIKFQPYVSQRAGMNIQGLTQRSAYGVMFYIQKFIDPTILVI